MKPFFFAALLLVAPCSHAQWGGFLDPEIMRRAGEDAATGNIRLNILDIDDYSDGPAPTVQYRPTAQDTAATRQSHEDDQRDRKNMAEREAQRARIFNRIERAYNAEFRK